MLSSLNSSRIIIVPRFLLLLHLFTLTPSPMHLFPISLGPASLFPPLPHSPSLRLTPYPSSSPRLPLCSLQSSALRRVSLTCTKNAFSAGENLRSIYITWWALSFSLQFMSLALCHASYSICFIIYAPSFVSLSLSLPLISPPHFLDFLCFSVVILNRLFSLFFPLISQVSHSNRSLAPQRCPPLFFSVLTRLTLQYLYKTRRILSNPTCIHI